MKTAPECPYCNDKARKAHGTEIYPGYSHLEGKRFWLCKPCDAYVGTHENSNWKPLGRLANKELRSWRMKAHRLFDPLWKGGKMKRQEAYAWLAAKLGIEYKQCHIAHFDVDMCIKVIAVMGGNESKKFNGLSFNGVGR